MESVCTRTFRAVFVRWLATTAARVGEPHEAHQCCWCTPATTSAWCVRLFLSLPYCPRGVFPCVCWRSLPPSIYYTVSAMLIQRVQYTDSSGGGGASLCAVCRLEPPNGLSLLTEESRRRVDGAAAGATQSCRLVAVARIVLWPLYHVSGSHR